MEKPKSASLSRILAVDDDPRFLVAVQSSLQSEYEVTTASDGMGAMRSMSQSQPDLVLLDYCLPQMSGLELLKIFTRRFPDVPIIMLTAEKDADTIIETMKNGASDFVIKATDDFVANLKFRIAQAMEKLALVRKNRDLLNENQTRAEENKKLVAKVRAQTESYEILGISAATLRLKSEILSLKGTRASILITGPNGTGKELVARTLNLQEQQPLRPFIDINCAAIPAALFESEFFGHAKGSFTGSVDNKEGKFKIADGGDIFLDEIAEIPLDLQAKLLRVIQQKVFTPVGSNKEISVNVRVIAATNRNLEEEVRNNRFREDLYYRLTTIQIQVTALRERPEDILFLAEEFLRQQLPMGKLAESTKFKLVKHHWRGNIRELHSVIERAVVFAKDSKRPTIKPEHILLTRSDLSHTKMAVPEDLLPLTVGDIAPDHFERCLNWMERQYMTRSLEAVKGDNEVLYNKLAVSRAYYFKRKKILGLLGNSLTEVTSQ